MRKMDDNDLKRLLEAQSAETRRHFELIAERTEAKVEAVSEAVSLLGTDLRGQIRRVEEKVDHGFADTQAMIKFSHAELDRRVLRLEEALANLQARVEKLESTIH